MLKIFLKGVLIFLLCGSCFAGIDFDGSDDGLSCGSSDTLNITGDISVIAFAKSDASSANRAVLSRFQNGGAFPGWVVRINSSDQMSIYNGLGFQESVSTIDEGNWHWYSWRIGVSKFYLYEDTTNLRTDNSSGRPNSASGQTAFIAIDNGGGSEFPGEISEVYVWSSFITNAEIALIVNAKVKGFGLQIQPSNLVGYWALDSGPDGTSADGDVFIDLSGTGNNCTGDDGAGNTGLAWVSEENLSYSVAAIYATVSAPAAGGAFQRGVMIF